MKNIPHPLIAEIDKRIAEHRQCLKIGKQSFVTKGMDEAFHVMVESVYLQAYENFHRILVVVHEKDIKKMARRAINDHFRQMKRSLRKGRISEALKYKIAGHALFQLQDEFIELND